MILIDDRQGSVEVAPLLSSPNNVCRLEFADFAWSGNGPKGQVSIGVERKRLTDFLKSMTSGRLSGHQLIGMSQQFDYLYIIIEGIWRPDRDTGILETPRGGVWASIAQGSRRFMARDIYNFINTLQVVCGVVVIVTSNVWETAKWLDSCHGWWEKKWSGHKSHLQFRGSEHAQLSKPNLTARIANQLTGIGWDRARKLGERFSPMELFEATEEELMEIEGIGPVLAGNVVKELS